MTALLLCILGISVGLGLLCFSVEFAEGPIGLSELCYWLGVSFLPANIGWFVVNGSSENAAIRAGLLGGCAMVILYCAIAAAVISFFLLSGLW